MNGPLFQYHSGDRMLVCCNENGQPLGGIPLAVVQRLDPKATHEAFARCLPRFDPAPRIVQAGPGALRGLDSPGRKR